MGETEPVREGRRPRARCRATARRRRSRSPGGTDGALTWACLSSSSGRGAAAYGAQPEARAPNPTATVFAREQRGQVLCEAFPAGPTQTPALCRERAVVGL